MRKEKRSIFAALLLLVLLIGTSCGLAEDDEDSRKEKPVTFEWYVNFSWFTGHWGTNMVSQAITDKTGVSIDFVVPSGNESEKLSSMMNAGSLPDIITLGSWEPQVSEMIENNMVYALNELADCYDVAFYQAADEEIVNWYTKEDGNIYSYPNSCYTPKALELYDNISSNQTFLVRKDIYEAIGSPDMTTQEGFVAAVKKAAEMFPEVDGEPLIPIGAHIFDDFGCVSFDKYLQNFLAVPFEENGEIYDRNTDPEYLSWLKMFRKLNEEGYLAPDIFVDTRTQMDEKIAQGRYFCMIYQYTDILSQERMLYANDPDSIYIAVDGPHNSKGDDPTLPVTGINGWTVTLISKNCRNPEKAIRFIDYMISEEGQMMAYYGVEGEMYDMVDGIPVVRPEVKALLDENRERYDEIYGGDDCYWMFQNAEFRLKWPMEEMEEVKKLRSWSYPYTVYTSQYDALSLADTEEAKADARIMSLWGKTLPELLMSASDEEFDRRLQEYVAKREEMNFEKVQDAKTKLMREAKVKLGLKEADEKIKDMDKTFSEP